MPGRLITFEGGEGAGKTTLIESLKSHLMGQGHEVVVSREPGGTVLGESLRHLVLHEGGEPVCDRAELLLFLASRAQHVHEVIQPAVEAGKIVLCDRFTESSLAYQGRRYEKGLAETLTHFGAYDCTPDLTLYLDLDPKIGLGRLSGGADKIESRSLAFHQEVRTAFLQLAKERAHMKVIDASQDKGDVLKAATRELENVV